MSQSGPPRARFTPSFFIRETLELGSKALPKLLLVTTINTQQDKLQKSPCGPWGAGRGQPSVASSASTLDAAAGEAEERLGRWEPCLSTPHPTPSVTELTWTGSSSFQGGLVLATKGPSTC